MIIVSAGNHVAKAAYKSQTEICSVLIALQDLRARAERSNTSRLTNDLKKSESNLANVQGQLSQAQSQISTLQQERTNLQSQLSALQAQANNLQGDRASLNAQINSLQNQISSLNGQISSLRSIVNLQASQVLRSQTTVNIPASQGVRFTYSSAIRYAGYLLISYTATGNVHLAIKSSSVSYTTASQSLANNIRAPVVPGDTWDVIIQNESFFAGTTVTITISYVY